MKSVLFDLQASLLDKEGFQSLEDYPKFTLEFLDYVTQAQPTKIISPTAANYIFFQYDADFGNRITRPLNIDLFVQSKQEFEELFHELEYLLNIGKETQGSLLQDVRCQQFIEKNGVNKVIYTMQQVIGCVSDSFENSNQARKRVGMLFERLMKLVIKEMGIECEPRTVRLPIPDFDGYTMPYELDVVFSRNKVEAQQEPYYIHDTEIVGSVKTTSKDRIDKIFLDKYLLTKLLGRDVPVVAIFLHDVQRAVRGNSIFGINSTFKTNHFLGYTVALNKLDGVYYVDPRPEMLVNERLREQIKDFQKLITEDIWSLSE